MAKLSLIPFSVLSDASAMHHLLCQYKCDAPRNISDTTSKQRTNPTAQTTYQLRVIGLTHALLNTNHFTLHFFWKLLATFMIFSMICADCHNPFGPLRLYVVGLWKLPKPLLAILEYQHWGWNYFFMQPGFMRCGRAGESSFTTNNALHVWIYEQLYSVYNGDTDGIQWVNECVLDGI